MALRIVLIAAPFCILAVLAVIDYFLRRGGGPGLGSSTELENRGLHPSHAGQPQQPTRPLQGRLSSLSHRVRSLSWERRMVSSYGPVRHH
jgi:hypothetical protein